MGRYPSGQRGQTVNLLPSASKVRILASPPHGNHLSRLALRVHAWKGPTVVTGDETGGRSSVVELQPSKLAVASSNLVARSIFQTPSAREHSATESMQVSGAHVAQLAEHVLGKDEVTRSIRVVGSKQNFVHPEALKIVRGGVIPQEL
jgi:hypothetical protein